MMNRVIPIFVIAMGVMLAFEAAVYGLIGLAALLMLMAGAFSYMLRGKPPKGFWLLLAALLLGPPVVACLVRLVLNEFVSIFGSSQASIAALIIILALIVLSFLYVRVRLASHKKGKEELHTNERQPVLPAHEEHGGDLLGDARD